MSRLRYFVPMLAFFTLALLLWRGLYLDPQDLPSVLIDKPVPVFAMSTLSGEAVGNRDLPKEMFLLNVWGSYCLPCLTEHPTLMRLSEQAEIPVIGINYKDQLQLARDWLDTHGNPFTFSIHDPQGLLGIDLGVYGAPETYLVDARGVIRYRHVAVLDEQVWRRDFLPLITRLQAETVP